MPQLLYIKTKADVPIKFQDQIELGDEKKTSPDDVAEQISKLLNDMKDGFELE